MVVSLPSLRRWKERFDQAPGRPNVAGATLWRFAGTRDGNEARAARWAGSARRTTGWPCASLIKVVVVQVIRTQWTKASRGAPAAARRAAVPDALAVPILTGLPEDAVAVVHEVKADEADGFEPRSQHRIITDGFPLRAAGLKVAATGEALEVIRLRESWNGWPSRPRDRIAFRLRQGEWGRAVRNNRHGNWHGWMYTKTVVNLAHLDALDCDLFIRSQPTHLLDEQASLR